MIPGLIGEKDLYPGRGLGMLPRLYGSLKEMKHRTGEKSLAVDEVPTRYHRPRSLTSGCNSCKCEEMHMVLPRRDVTTKF